ncbi:MAG: outer membrane beta-barrel protein [Enhydrobacter sp.]|nr:MAG: outer membrane beta-barrel protein [Enhydrobacter sp.]
MKSIKRVAFAVALVLGAGVSATDDPAQAQTQAQQAPGSERSPLQRQERDQRGPAAIAAESYDPVGVPVGSFRLFPELELDEVYNDNIYAANSGKTGSFIQLIKPTLDLRSDWNNHMLNVVARGAFGFYSANSTENFQDFSFASDGRIDIQRNWNVYGGASWSRRHEERGTPNAVTSTFPPNKYNQLVANLGYYQAFNRFSVRLDGRMDNYNFVDSGPGPAAGAIFNGDRDRTEFRETLRLGYEFSPGYQVWTRGGLNQRTYSNMIDSLGFTHNSSGWDVVGGVSIDLGGITAIELFAGYMQQNYRDPRYPVVQGPSFGLTGFWNPIRELFIKPFVRRTIEESALTSTSAYFNTAFGVDVDYRVRPNIKVDGHFDYSIADYSVTSGAASRYDQYVVFRASVTYNPTREFFIGPMYQFTNRNSNVAGSGYDQNIVMLRLGARL